MTTSGDKCNGDYETFGKEVMTTSGDKCNGDYETFVASKT
jgi:hypothetical protein